VGGVVVKILDGTALAKEIRGEVAAGVVEMQQNHGVTPGLAAILVGEDPASAIYVRNKRRACDEAGLISETFNLPSSTSQGELLELVDRLNHDPAYHGILLQLPLAKHMDEATVLMAVHPEKDVDCIHPTNLGRLAQGSSPFVPATPGGVQQILMRNGYDPAGKHVVICGRPPARGRPSEDRPPGRRLVPHVRTR